ncbi:MAG: AbrB/MazE/SpoVT family DNA-binding domain-containing protein [Chloroflexi bacterium]|nr:AbrB/MazE/SpoVT family DNA-binding domain-containing protein [Chloroflexota bacterium]
MEIAKITSKGQITLPIYIRRKLGVKKGDNVLFVEDDGKFYLLNSSMEALKDAQIAFSGETDRLGLKNDEDVVSMVKDIRKKRMAK